MILGEEYDAIKNKDAGSNLMRNAWSGSSRA